MDCNIETFFCNQKHLILNDRVYIENELAKETTLQLSFAKTLLRFLKKFVPTDYPIGIIKVLSKILCNLFDLSAIDKLYKKSLRCRSLIIPGRTFRRKKNKATGRTHFNTNPCFLKSIAVNRAFL